MGWFGLGCSLLQPMQPDLLAPELYYDLRLNGRIPEGRCVYIQSGDPGDFDGKTLTIPSQELLAQCASNQVIVPFSTGYLIAVAGVQLQRRTRHLQLALVASLDFQQVCVTELAVYSQSNFLAAGPVAALLD